MLSQDAFLALLTHEAHKNATAQYSASPSHTLFVTPITLPSKQPHHKIDQTSQTADTISPQENRKKRKHWDVDKNFPKNPFLIGISDGSIGFFTIPDSTIELSSTAAQEKKLRY